MQRDTIKSETGTYEHLKFGVGSTTLRGYFFLKKKRALCKNKKGTSLFTAKS